MTQGDNRILVTGRPVLVSAVVATAAMYDAELPALEQVLVARAVEARRREFAAARAVARAALGRLGVPPSVILRANDRAPAWPEGFVGTITHCEGCCCAVARSAAAGVIGVDAELLAPLDNNLAMQICRPDELVAFGGLPIDGPDWPKLVFSAKEAFDRCYNP